MENHGEVEEAVTYTSTDRDSKLVDTSSSMTRDAKIVRTSIIGIIANIFLAGFKIFCGLDFGINLDHTGCREQPVGFHVQCHHDSRHEVVPEACR